MANLLVLLHLAALLQLYGASTHLKAPRPTNSWAVEITWGGNQMAEKIARQNGFRNLGPVSFYFKSLVLCYEKLCRVSNVIIQFRDSRPIIWVDCL